MFVDTAGWVAAADAADPLNGEVRAARDEWLAANGLLVTTDHVLDETLTTIRFRLGSRRPRRGGSFSFTDCTSFADMKSLRLRKVLTLDRHFAQMGFEVVPVA